MPRASSNYVYPRSTVERVNGRLKDSVLATYAWRSRCHLMFGIVALTVDQLLRMLN